MARKGLISKKDQVVQNPKVHPQFLRNLGSFGALIYQRGQVEEKNLYIYRFQSKAIT